MAKRNKKVRTAEDMTGHVIDVLRSRGLIDGNGNPIVQPSAFKPYVASAGSFSQQSEGSVFDDLL